MSEKDNGSRELNRMLFEVLEQIVDRARSEPEWKEKMIADPPAALKEAGWLSDELDPATAEVVGRAGRIGLLQQPGAKSLAHIIAVLIRL